MATLAYTGDVTALLAVDLGTLVDLVTGPEAVPQWLLLAGLGSQLHAYLLPAGRRLCCQAVLPGGTRVHGIAAVALPALPGSVLLAVHGGRHAAVVRLDWAAGGGGALAPLCALPQLDDWTMAVHLSLAAGSPASALLAVGLSDNSLQVHAVALTDGRRRPLLAARGAERSLLYSMALQQRPAAGGGGGVRYWVAAGTIFQDVVVWDSATVGASAAVGGGAAAAGGSPDLAPTLFRLRGHEGSIHRWAAAVDPLTLDPWSMGDASPKL